MYRWMENSHAYIGARTEFSHIRVKYQGGARQDSIAASLIVTCEDCPVHYCCYMITVLIDVLISDAFDGLCLQNKKYCFTDFYHHQQQHRQHKCHHYHLDHHCHEQRNNPVQELDSTINLEYFSRPFYYVRFNPMSKWWDML